MALFHRSLLSLSLFLLCRPCIALNTSVATQLPDPLTTKEDQELKPDQRVMDPADLWRNLRRPELLKLAAEKVYGCAPERPKNMRFEVQEQASNAFGGKATRKQVTIHFDGDTQGPKTELLIYVPNDRKGPAPAFLAINFWGNQTVNADPTIRLPESWEESGKYPWADLSVIKEHRATEASRGINAAQWPIEKIIERGYALVTFYRGDIFADSLLGNEYLGDPLQTGLLGAHPELQNRDDNFSGIGAWAWALSRALDYLETEPAINAHKVAVFGWSRLGKAAIWAGAEDERFAMVISNESGKGGAALSKHLVGETVEHLNQAYPYWFCKNFRKYSKDVSALPFDQNKILALIAPRPLYVASAIDDTGSDPLGEFLAVQAASSMWPVLGETGLTAKEWPAVNQPVQGRVAYHVRSGDHDVTEFDWSQYLDFADRFLW
jgi:hypothetical protein